MHLAVMRVAVEGPVAVAGLAVVGLAAAVSPEAVLEITVAPDRAPAHKMALH